MALTRIRIKKQVELRVEFVSMEDISVEIADITHEPYTVLRSKTKQVSELLGCTEEEAERLILDRLGA